MVHSTFKKFISQYAPNFLFLKCTVLLIITGFLGWVEVVAVETGHHSLRNTPENNKNLYPLVSASFQLKT